jgi:hypothetical protein
LCLGLLSWSSSRAKVIPRKYQRFFRIHFSPSPYQSQSADAKSVAKAYGVTEDRANNVAGQAAAMSGGNASKQDMIDALKPARGE